MFTLTDGMLKPKARIQYTVNVPIISLRMQGLDAKRTSMPENWFSMRKLVIQ